MTEPVEPLEQPASDEPAPDGGWDEDDLADEMSKESFPTSDPPSTWGGADRG
jgi:hypothetical protein